MVALQRWGTRWGTRWENRIGKRWGGYVTDPIAEMFARLGGVGTWVDPRMGSTVYADTAGTTPATVGGTVARIDAAGGVAASFRNATAAQRPILRADGNEFDGVDDRLVAPDDPALRFGTGDVTFAIAALNTGTSGFGSILNKRASAGGPGFNFGMDRVNNKFRTVLQDAAVTRLGFAGPNESFPPGTWNIVLIEVDRTAGVARHYISGVYQSGFDLALGTFGDISNMEPIVLGATGSGSTGWAGSISRLLAIDKRLSAADKATVENWLQAGFQ